MNFAAENLRRPLKIQIAGWRANVFAEDLNCRAQIWIFSGPSKALPEN
jgi:hypothetical protein